jgi:uncharacterized protein (DUF488 family)
MNLYTIGFTKKSAEEFFSLLIDNKIQKVVDIRRNNKSQLAGFTKKGDLKYFLKKIANITYIHLIDFAPDQILIEKYRKKKLSWTQYEEEYLKQIKNYEKWNEFDIKDLKDGCLLCSESSPKKCHRRLFAEFLLNKYINQSIQIIHL